MPATTVYITDCSIICLFAMLFSYPVMSNLLNGLLIFLVSILKMKLMLMGNLNVPFMLIILCRRINLVI